jgi:putative membrane protein insertion efficiency factor
MKKILIAIVRSYKFLISPLLPGSCRFVPSCSEYSLEALEKYGALKGVWLSVRRVARCHPFHPGGYDPVK